jgi:hypothetical protein
MSFAMFFAPMLPAKFGEIPTIHIARVMPRKLRLSIYFKYQRIMGKSSKGAVGEARRIHPVVNNQQPFGCRFQGKAGPLAAVRGLACSIGRCSKFEQVW